MLRRLVLLSAAGVTLALSACVTAPYTGRKQLILMDIGAEMSLGATSYQEELGQVRVSQDAALTEMVSRVSMAIAREASKDQLILAYCPKVANFEWEVRLIDSPMVNANCRPGGKMIVYTGILPYTQTEAGLAAVMGHEVAHAVMRHGNERISQNMLLQVGMAGLEMGLQEQDPTVRAGVLGAFGAGASYGILLPFSREHESEADHIGLILMAKAGYDPRESEQFWTRMAQSGGEKPPEWMSTHPADETRIRQIREWLPEALTYYKGGAAPAAPIAAPAQPAVEPVNSIPPPPPSAEPGGPREVPDAPIPSVGADLRDGSRKR